MVSMASCLVDIVIFSFANSESNVSTNPKTISPHFHQLLTEFNNAVRFTISALGLIDSPQLINIGTCNFSFAPRPSSWLSHWNSQRLYSFRPQRWRGRRREALRSDLWHKGVPAFWWTSAVSFSFASFAFQELAVGCVERDESALVAAHASTYKTAAVEYARGVKLRENQRVACTSPIKALSNQKYREFNEKWELWRGNGGIDDRRRMDQPWCSNQRHDDGDSAGYAPGRLRCSIKSPGWCLMKRSTCKARTIGLFVKMQSSVFHTKSKCFFS